jgi:cephalosporin-C deacetylase-like acetyl esterase
MDPLKSETIILANGMQQINGGTLNKAGFLRLTAIAEVDGKEYRNLATAAFSPEEIKPTVQNPSDFDSFWATALQDLAKIPMDAKMTLLPERCTEKTLVYHVNIQNNAPGARLYGILCVPKKEGKYPAILHVPGAGVRPYAGDIANAEKGIITLQIGIHGIPVNMEPGVYADLVSGALRGYPSFNIQDKNRFYYKRVYLGCVRANDFLTSLPQYDGKNLVVTGGSQGGALSIVTAALDKRVQYLAALYPAISDVTGYLQNRAGGWPHYFDKNNKPAHDFPEVLQTVSYYDVVNFARRITVPGMYTWGFNDETCPPTSMYAAYNLISAPKELFLALETGHWTYPEQGEKLTNWLVSKIKN